MHQKQGKESLTIGFFCVSSYLRFPFLHHHLTFCFLSYLHSIIIIIITNMNFPFISNEIHAIMYWLQVANSQWLKTFLELFFMFTSTLTSLVEIVEEWEEKEEKAEEMNSEVYCKFNFTFCSSFFLYSSEDWSDLISCCHEKYIIQLSCLSLIKCCIIQGKTLEWIGWQTVKGQILNESWKLKREKWWNNWNLNAFSSTKRLQVLATIHWMNK